jgi:hypothetical protein
MQEQREIVRRETAAQIKESLMTTIKGGRVKAAVGTEIGTPSMAIAIIDTKREASE